jgi:uncharacterized protein (DUF924 family)
MRHVAYGCCNEIANVIAFWRASGPALWFAKSAHFDAEFCNRFFRPHFAAARREHDHWADKAQGALALLLLLDQFPRNAFRGTGHMYATDPLARMFAKKMIAAGFDLEIDSELRRFCYLPFAHSENLTDQERSVELSNRLGDNYVGFARRHCQIIRRFGRFPHRNAILGRDTTAEERTYLSAGGFAG